MTIASLVKEFKGDNSTRISIWTGLESFGDWFGTFPIKHIPNEYAEKEVTEWYFYDSTDEEPYGTIVVVINE